jgi:hypothetical protein
MWSNITIGRSDCSAGDTLVRKNDQVNNELTVERRAWLAPLEELWRGRWMSAWWRLIMWNKGENMIDLVGSWRVKAVRNVLWWRSNACQVVLTDQHRGSEKKVKGGWGCQTCEHSWYLKKSCCCGYESGKPPPDCPINWRWVIRPVYLL